MARTKKTARIVTAPAEEPQGDVNMAFQEEGRDIEVRIRNFKFEFKPCRLCIVLYDYMTRVEFSSSRA